MKNSEETAGLTAQSGNKASGTVTLLATGLCISLCGIIFSLFLAEIAFRLFWPKPSAQWNDRPTQYFIAENSDTFQDYHYSKEKPAGTFRIAVIGDSFTFAPFMQFDDAFPKRLERWLNLNQEQVKVEVINYGVPAYSTSHEVPVVARAIAEQADLILMQITLNDPEIKPYTPQQLSRERNKFGDLELTHPVFHYWRSLAFVLTRIHNENTRSNYRKKFYRLFERKDTWNNFSGSWRKIATLAGESKTPLAAVTFPLFGHPIDQHYPFWPIHEKVADLMSSLNIPALDLTRIYTGIPLQRLQVMPGQDFHPNEIAHRMAAEAIYRWLRDKKLVPTSIIARISSAERIGIKKPTIAGLEEKSPS